MAFTIAAFVGAWWLVRGPETADESPGGSGRVAPEEGALAPDFQAADGEGTLLRLSDYRGRPVLVNFWATWCPACVAELPAIQAVLDHERDQGFEVIAVSLQEDATDAQRFLDDLGVGPRLALDPDGSIARLYQVVGLPASFFVDRDGVIRKVWLGQMTPQQVEEFTHDALEGREASGPTEQPVGLTVLLDPEGPGTLYLLSPAIRCDADYCANHLLLALHGVPAVQEARSVPQGEGGALVLFVRFDPAVGGPEDVVSAFRKALRERPDPVLGAEVAVRYLLPVEDSSP